MNCDRARREVRPGELQWIHRKSEIANEDWLPDMDLNHDKQIQSLLCYRYTIGQAAANKLERRHTVSRTTQGKSEDRNPKFERNPKLEA